MCRLWRWLQGLWFGADGMIQRGCYDVEDDER